MSSAQEIYKEKMSKTLSVLKEDLNTVRAGRANAALLDQISLDYYGTQTPLKNLANIQVPDPRTLMIKNSGITTLFTENASYSLKSVGFIPRYFWT